MEIAGEAFNLPEGLCKGPALATLESREDPSGLARAFRSSA